MEAVFYDFIIIVYIRIYSIYSSYSVPTWLALHFPVTGMDTAFESRRWLF